jgi:hypothetical protein
MNHQKLLLASIMLVVASGLMTVGTAGTITNVHGQVYDFDYGNDHYKAYLELKSSHVDIQKIKCVNSNTNINGIDITKIPPDPTAQAAANEGGAEGGNTQNGNSLADKINFQRNLVNVCVNVNDNEQKVSPPETTLSVKKTITCDLSDNPAPEEVEACQRITTEILPEYFTIFVSGNNPNPDTFTGSMVPEIVTLRPGDYVVSETRDESKVDGTRADIESDLGVLLDGPAPKYSGDCKTNVLTGEGEGTIAAGESHVCNVENLFRFT